MGRYLKLRDGIELYYRKDIPEKPKAIVLIVHGFAEHLNRYDHVCEMFLKRDYGVYRYDLRGHGRTKGLLGHIDRFQDLIEDNNEMVNLILSESSNIPIFILGHSMGGLITALYGIEYPKKIRGQIFSGAAFNSLPSAKGIKKYFLSIGAKFMPVREMKNPINKGLCSVEKVVEDYINDPLVLKKASLNFYNEFLIQGINSLQKNIELYDYPCFITTGEMDKIVPKELSIDFYNRISSKDKEFKIYKGLYHEILNEIEKDQVQEDMIQWLNRRV